MVKKSVEKRKPFKPLSSIERKIFNFIKTLPDEEQRKAFGFSRDQWAKLKRLKKQQISRKHKNTDKGNRASAATKGQKK